MTKRFALTKKSFTKYSQYKPSYIVNNILNTEIYKTTVSKTIILLKDIPFLQAFLTRTNSFIKIKPFMRAMSTVDHKRIRVMYLLFRLFARIMRV